MTKNNVVRTPPPPDGIPGPRPWCHREGPKGQIPLNFNYKVNFESVGICACAPSTARSSCFSLCLVYRCVFQFVHVQEPHQFGDMGWSLTWDGPLHGLVFYMGWSLAWVGL